MGFGVGVFEGARVVGFTVGAILGSLDGYRDGGIMGSPLGIAVGLGVGMPVGERLGSPLGISLGVTVGAEDKLGAVEGFWDGVGTRSKQNLHEKGHASLICRPSTILSQRTFFAWKLRDATYVQSLSGLFSFNW